MIKSLLMNLIEYLKAPPAIGGTTPAAGSFTTLSNSGIQTATGGVKFVPSTRADSNESVPAAEMYGHPHRCGYARTYTLPSAVVGMSATFRTTAAVAVSIKAGASDAFIFSSSSLDNGDKLTNNSTIGDELYVKCTVANKWDAYSLGTWADTGA